MSNFFKSELKHNISLELRVKERLLLNPEEVFFFDSQGIPVTLLSSCFIMRALVKAHISTNTTDRIIRLYRISVLLFQMVSH